MSSLHVGFLCHGWVPDVGGVESHTADLARELRARGQRVSAMCLDYGEGKAPFSTTETVREGVALTRMAYRYHDHDRLARVVVNEAADAVVRAWLARVEPDVVHVHHVTGFGLGALHAIADAGVPLVMTLHDYWSLCPRGQMLDWEGQICARAEPARCAACLGATWEHLMPSAGALALGPRGEQLDSDEQATAARSAYALDALRRAQRLFTPSAAARAVYVRAGLALESIDVVENGIEVGELAAEVARARGPARAGALVLGVLGSALPSKGVLELCRAFASAPVEGLRIEVHGNLPPYHGDSSYVDELQELARTTPALEVCGPYSRVQLPALLARLDAVAAPSRWEEVYGLTVREARAAGLPVIVSDAGDLPAVAAGGSAGLVVPRDDPGAWRAALERFVHDDDARRSWAAAVTPLRTTSEMALQLVQAYAEALRALGRRPPSAGLWSRLCSWLSPRA